MRIGPTVRRAFGKHELQITEGYRCFFVSLKAVATAVASLRPESVLEVGVGEGLVTNRLARLLPEARFVGIDTTPAVGRLFRGSTDRVTFHQSSVEEYLAKNSDRFDLVLICDVMHHVPIEARPSVLHASRRLLTPSGHLIVKDWEPRSSIVHAVAKFSDRVITGDTVTYYRPDQMRELVNRACPDLRCLEHRVLPPWRNNFMLTFGTAD
jgi:2-polyprenyl-3-methyl-5-hydroxy-6-metoxy-1,4-benzoquinol methylase